MSIEALRKILLELPWRLKDGIEGYANAVMEASPRIFENANVKWTEKKAQELAFFAAIRRFWGIVDGQYWLIDNGLSLLAEQDAAAFSIGGSIYARGTEVYAEVRELRDKFEGLLNELGIGWLTERNSFGDLLEELAHNG